MKSQNSASSFSSTFAAFSAVLLSFSAVGQLSAEPYLGNPLSAVINMRGQAKTVDVLRDDSDVRQFYYLPVEPRLTEESIAYSDGSVKTVPKLFMLSYQMEGDAVNTAVEGGILQFATNLALSDQEIQEIKLSLVASGRVASESGELLSVDEITVSPIPVSDARVVVTYNGTVSGGGGKQEGVAPTSFSGIFPFSAKLDKQSTNIAYALTGLPMPDGSLSETAGGVQVTYGFVYEAVKPPLGVSVVVNWDEVKKLDSTITKSESREAWNGWLASGINHEKNYTEVIEADETLSKAIDIDIKTGENFDITEVNKYLGPVMEEIYREMRGEDPDSGKFANEAEGKPASPEGQPEEGGDDDKWSSGWFYSDDSYSETETREIESTKSGTVTYDLEVESRVKEKSSASSFINVATYPADVRRSLVQFVGDGGWDSSYLLLPAIDAGLGISSVYMQVRASFRDDLSRGGDWKMAQWTPDSGQWWINDQASGQMIPAKSMLFLLKQYREAYGEQYKKQMVFDIQTTINAPGQPGQIVDRFQIPMATGDGLITQPTGNVRAVNVKSFRMPFGNGDNDLVAAEVQLRDGERTISKTFEKRGDTLSFLVQSENGVVNYDSQIEYYTNGDELGDGGLIESFEDGITRTTHVPNFVKIRKELTGQSGLSVPSLPAAPQGGGATPPPPPSSGPPPLPPLPQPIPTGAPVPIPVGAPPVPSLPPVPQN